MHILRAEPTHLEILAPLFDGYRSFYGQASDLLGATAFLKDRLEREDSVIFIAFAEKKGVGFTQLYPSFSSVSMEPLLILNDLYVDPQFRDQGIGGQLLLQAQHYAAEHGQKGLQLSTAIDNPAQRLYEKLGWKRDREFYHYFWKVNA